MGDRTPASRQASPGHHTCYPTVIGMYTGIIMKGTDKDLILSRQVEETEAAISDYHESDAFVRDLTGAFAAASRRAAVESRRAAIAYQRKHSLENIAQVSDAPRRGFDVPLVSPQGHLEQINRQVRRISTIMESATQEEAGEINRLLEQYLQKTQQALKELRLDPSKTSTVHDLLEERSRRKERHG